MENREAHGRLPQVWRARLDAGGKTARAEIRLVRFDGNQQVTQ